MKIYTHQLQERPSSLCLVSTQLLASANSTTVAMEERFIRYAYLPLPESPSQLVNESTRIRITLSISSVRVVQRTNEHITPSRTPSAFPFSSSRSRSFDTNRSLYAFQVYLHTYLETTEVEGGQKNKLDSFRKRMFNAKLPLKYFHRSTVLAWLQTLHASQHYF